MSPPPTWTPEMEATLRDLWNGYKLSSNEIAQRMNIGRGAVMSKIVRMGLPKHTRKRPRSAKTQAIVERRERRAAYLATLPPAERERLASVNLRKTLRKVKPDRVSSLCVMPQPERKVLELIDPTELRVPIWDLEPHHCRWPVAGAREHTLFCGRDKRVGAYCHKHARESYTRTA